MTTLCHINDIEDDAAKSFEVDDRVIFAVKKFGKIHIYVNSCPHIGIPLEFLPDASGKFNAIWGWNGSEFTGTRVP